MKTKSFIRIGRALGSLLILTPLSIIYALSVGIYYTGITLMGEIADIITFNKEVWKNTTI